MSVEFIYKTCLSWLQEWNERKKRHQFFGCVQTSGWQIKPFDKCGPESLLGSWWKSAIWDTSRTSLSFSFFLISSDSCDVSRLFNLPSSLLHLPLDKELSVLCTTSATQRGTVTLLRLTCCHHACVATWHVARRLGSLASCGTTEACPRFCTMFSLCLEYFCNAVYCILLLLHYYLL